MNKRVALSVIVVVLLATMLACQASSFLPTTAIPAVQTPITSTTQPVAANLVNEQDKLVSLFRRSARV